MPAQLATSYDRSILGAQRVMRAILPHMRHRSQGLVVWLASNAAAGGAAPCHAFHCSIAAGVEAMAVQYARELARWGIETSIVMPGLFGELTNPFRDALRPDDTERVVEYEAGPNRGLGDAVRQGVAKANLCDTLPRLLPSPRRL
ncbi:SDR family NAD(P)-dependent oxidoreductase (plasmid) [Azospirillum brasilense]|nr:SDR family NAD(P)-dependent oxidoreductase [Azospirillum brasilense]